MGRATQASRGVIVGLVVIGLAAAAHLVGGGLPAPVSPGFVALALLSLVACAVLSHQEWTLVRQLVCLAGSQVVFHAVLEVERDAAGLRWPVQHPELNGAVEVGPSMLMTSPAHSERKVMSPELRAHPRGRALAVALATAALALSACSSGSSSTTTRTSASSGDITVSAAYVNEPTLPERTGAFATIANTGTTAVSLTSASVPASVAASAAVHETVMVDGAMTMQEVSGGVPVPPGGQLVLKSGAFHVMLMKPTVSVGQTVPLTLGFSDGSTITVDAPVLAPSSAPASPSMSSSS